MIVGLGIDVVDVARLERLIGASAPKERARRFLERCFTARERAFCDARKDRATCYAGRFAAKEAVVKALGAPPGVRWTDIEVSSGQRAPEVKLGGAADRAARGLAVESVHLSLTHDGGIAAAAAVLEARRSG
jgi:holo-[acyl-carrier protein] synthase